MYGKMAVVWGWDFIVMVLWQPVVVTLFPSLAAVWDVNCFPQKGFWGGPCSDFPQFSVLLLA